MDRRTEIKKTNLLAIIATIEDATLINGLHSYMSKFKEITEVKLLTTQDIMKTEREEAVHILDLEVSQIERDIKKITSLDSEIFDDYFYKYNFANTEDHYRIAYDFDRVGAYLEIVFDNVYDIKKILKGIRVNGEC